MTHSTLDDVRRQIIASMDEVTAAGPVRRWHGRPIDWVYRNHLVALGIVDMLENIARSLGERRVKLFADEDTPPEARLSCSSRRTQEPPGSPSS
jgi:hypothetical protein